MRNSGAVLANSIFLITTLFVASAVAQEPAAATANETSAAAANTNAADEKKTAPDNKQPAKKTVQDATINLQTTITGNQEQPRVLYILPWQSPAATDVDFESLDNEHKAVFGHVEREELRRELESSDVLQ